MTANGGARREENRSETERASLDFPSNSVQRQSKFCEAALTNGGFWSKKLVDQDHSRTCVCVYWRTPRFPHWHAPTAPPRGWQNMWRWQQLVSCCFGLFFFFHFLLLLISLSWTYRNALQVSSTPPNVSALTRTLRSHLPVCVWPSGVTCSQRHGALTEKPPWQLQSQVCKEKQNKCICVCDLFLFPLADCGSHAVSLWRQYRLQ